MVQGQFGVLGPPCDSCGQRAGGAQGDPPHTLQECTVSAGHGPLPSGWFGGEELRFPAEFSRTVCADGLDEEYHVNLLLVGTGDSRLMGECYLLAHPLRMRALSQILAYVSPGYG